MCVCRYVFSELRQEAEQLTRHPNFPALVSTIIAKTITFISSMPPPPPPPPPRVMQREA